jgi:hypothetical protein
MSNKDKASTAPAPAPARTTLRRSDEYGGHYPDCIPGVLCHCPIEDGAPAPAGGPPLDAAQREIKTCHEMLDSNRDVLPAGLLPERLSALLADIDRMTSQLRADREVPASVMEMPMDAAARVRDGVRPAPASGGRDELGFSAFEERWANIIAEYESDDIVSDIIRPMVRESVRKVDAIEVAILAHQLAPYVKEIDAFAIVRSILGHLGIATPATAEREG